jgi:chromosome segregation ATPase
MFCSLRPPFWHSTPTSLTCNFVPLGCCSNEGAQSEVKSLRDELEQARSQSSKMKEDLTHAQSELTAAKDLAKKHTDQISSLEKQLEEASRQALNAKNELLKRDQQMETEMKQSAAASSECARLQSRLAALEDSLRAASFREEQIKKENSTLLAKDAERAKVLLAVVWGYVSLLRPAFSYPH